MISIPNLACLSARSGRQRFLFGCSQAPVRIKNPSSVLLRAASDLTVQSIKARIGLFGPTRDAISLALSVLADIAASRLAAFRIHESGGSFQHLTTWGGPSSSAMTSMTSMRFFSTCRPQTFGRCIHKQRYPAEVREFRQTDLDEVTHGLVPVFVEPDNFAS